MVVTDPYSATNEDCLVVTINPEDNSAPEFEVVDNDLEFTLDRDGDIDTNTIDVELCAEASDSDSDE